MISLKLSFSCCNIASSLFFNSFCGSKRETNVREEFKKIPEIFNIIPESNWNFVRHTFKKSQV